MLDQEFRSDFGAIYPTYRLAITFHIAQNIKQATWVSKFQTNSSFSQARNGFIAMTT